jgi:hypothetical protein
MTASRKNRHTSTQPTQIASTPKRSKDVNMMNIRAGEILISHEGGQYYRVLEVNEFSVSLMRVDGQTIFACQPAFAAAAFSIVSSSQVSET